MWRWLQKQKGGTVNWYEFCEEMRLQFGPDELEDPLAALANLKQTGTVQEYHQAFIKLAHMVEDSVKNLIILFLVGLREDLCAKVNLDKPSTMVSAYRHACARESINLIERKMSKLQPYKGPNVTATQTIPAGKSLVIPTNDKGWAGSQDSHEKANSGTDRGVQEKEFVLQV